MILSQLKLQMDRRLVFVYGTLKTGQPNHPQLLDKSNGTSQLIGKGKTLEKWPLVIASKYNIPFLIYKAKAGKEITGEIYSVNEKMLQFLDEFEGHPNYYRRIEEKVMLEDGSVLNPWIYFLIDYHPQLLTLPTIGDYSSYGDHGLPYVERCDRDHSNDGMDENNEVINQVKLILQ